jgi:uncharacterized protein (DUF2141 family)
MRSTHALGGLSCILSTSFLLALALPGSVAAQAPATATLTVNVSSAKSAQGKVRVDLYNSANGFPDKPANAFRHEVVDIDAKALTAKAVFADLPHGVYAVAVHHDENGNGEMDKNILGIPKEGHGASNNPTAPRRPPNFDEGKFTLIAPQTLDIKLFY